MDTKLQMSTNVAPYLLDKKKKSVSDFARIRGHAVDYQAVNVFVKVDLNQSLSLCCDTAKKRPHRDLPLCSTTSNYAEKTSSQSLQFIRHGSHSMQV